MTNQNLSLKQKRQNRISKHVLSSSNRPRLMVHRSNLHITSQIVDRSGKVLAAATSHGLKAKGTKTEIAAQVGKIIADAALKAKVDIIVFDRRGYRYHGRVKALAEAVRASGIKF